jgi:hypothetical protein
MQARTELQIADLSGIKELGRTNATVEVAQVGHLTPRAIRDGDSGGGSATYGSGKSIADTINARRQASGYYPTNDSELATATRAPTMSSGLSSRISPTARTGLGGSSQVPTMATSLGSRGSRTTPTPFGQGSTVLPTPITGLSSRRRGSGSASTLRPTITPANQSQRAEAQGAASQVFDEMVVNPPGSGGPPQLVPGIARDTDSRNNPDLA